MTKIDLQTIGFTDSTSTLINANSFEIETKSDTFLSRVGTSPNEMLADLDMNSNRILNLTTPLSATEPLRFQDLTSFIGGSLTIPDLTNIGNPIVITANYGLGGTANSFLKMGRGTLASPNTSSGAIAIFQKITNATSTTDQNTTVYSSIIKTTNGSGHRATAVYTEAEDRLGWSGVGNNGFIEGTRTQATLRTGCVNGSAYGLITVAGADNGVGYKYLVSSESDVLNQSGVNAPTVGSFSTTSFSAGYLATSSGANKVDGGFITNPFNASTFRTGFLVAQNSVDDTAFASRAATVVGLDLVSGSQSFAAIMIPNNTAIRAKNNAGNSHLNILALDSSDRLNLGFDTTGVLTPAFMHAMSNTAMPAGGTAGQGYRLSSTTNFGIFFGSGAPTLSAAKGSLYLRSDGSGTTDRAYINTNGTTTWTALTTVA